MDGRQQLENMTKATVIRITTTGINYIVHVRPAAKTVVFYGWNDAVIKSATPMPDQVYILEGQYDDRDFTGQSRPTVPEIVAAFEAMAVEIPTAEKHVSFYCDGCGEQIAGIYPYGYTTVYCKCGHETEVANV